jgi:hypothetical protein
MGLGSSPALDGEISSLGAIGAFPYAGLGTTQSILSVASQALIGPNASTAVALSALQSALANNTGSIDVIAYSGGAQAFASAISELSSADQARIGNIVYLSPGMGGGSLATPNGVGNVTVVLGSDWVDVAATVGTTIPAGVRTIQSSCNHTDIACLLQNAPLAQITADGACTNPGVFQLGSAAGAGAGGSAGGTGGAPGMGGVTGTFDDYLINLYLNSMGDIEYVHSTITYMM